jgi:hypothetical protein
MKKSKNPGFIVFIEKSWKLEITKKFDENPQNPIILEY